ncbi:MAG: cob(I)yrinic acid a,c-diamide adenosyltransferase [Bacillota bacterium]|nr:cob(I)yrinic acid a,c-diamide adenosyltransferase [Bacillota bacterium]
MLKKGYVQVYTGNGKGKTTASLGLVMRAAAAGMRVYIGQFIKDAEYNEIRCLKQRFPEVTVEQYGSGKHCLIDREEKDEDRISAANGYSKAKEALISGLYDVVVLDEINMSAYFNLISNEEILELIELKPEKTELILTGRYASNMVKDAADLVTEMHEEKHYYRRGVLARPGIEM